MSLSAAEHAALTRFDQLVNKPELIVEIWQRRDLFEEEGQVGVAIEVGRPVELTALEGRCRANGYPLPPMVRALLERADGLDIDGCEEAGAQLSQTESLDGVLNGLRPCASIEIGTAGADAAYTGLGFGVPYGQEPVIVDRNSGHIVFDDNRGQVIVVATSLAAFVDVWCDYGLSLSALLGDKIDAAE